MTKETCSCPRCSAESALESCDEVDIGVGVMRGNFLWDCPKCGRWAANERQHFEAQHHEFWFLDLGATLFRPHRCFARHEEETA